MISHILHIEVGVSTTRKCGGWRKSGSSDDVSMNAHVSLIEVGFSIASKGNLTNN